MSAREEEQRTSNAFFLAFMSDTNVQGLRVHLSFPPFHAALWLQLLPKSQLPLRARERERTSDALCQQLVSSSILPRVNFSFFDFFLARLQYKKYFSISK